jgi:hypothetical protein
MQFSDKEYFQASLERMRQAKTLYAEGDAYGMAMYCGGLAVECLFRAFRTKVNPSFDSRHDLNALLKASGILRVDDQYMRNKGRSEKEIREAAQEFRGAINEVVVLWHNNLRFASEARLKTYLRKSHRVQGVKGNPLKKNAADLIEAAQRIINKGIVLWS